MSFRNTLLLLRFPYSLYLMPVFLFALSQVSEIHLYPTLLLFFILHFLVYPSSNGYNSYMDRDTDSIGGIKNPPMAGRQLFYVSLGLDILALMLSALLNPELTLMILLYILASRAYSYRGIRLKKYPIAGFVTVFFFQGAFTYLLVTNTLEWSMHNNVYLAATATSLMIGASYPLTQIYQHKQDRKDGVITLSILLGIRGTFIFSGIFFLVSLLTFLFYFQEQHHFTHFLFFAFFTSPVVLYFLYWFYRTYKDPLQANFENAMMMNKMAAYSLIAAFTGLIVINSPRIIL